MKNNFFKILSIFLFNLFFLCLISSLNFSCTNPTESNSTISISGYIYNRCNSNPLGNIYIKLFGRYTSGVYIHKKVLSQNNGFYEFFIPDAGGIEFLKIGINNGSAGLAVPFFPDNFNYSVTNFDASPSRDTKQDILLAPRVDVNIKAKADTTMNPAKFISLSIDETFSNLNQNSSDQSIYYSDSVLCKLGAGYNHSVTVKFQRNNSEFIKSKEFILGCNEINVTILY